MPDYKKAKIYKIYGEGTDLIYIGHTTSPLAVRLSGHLTSNTNTCVKKIIDAVGADNVKIELVETYPCDTHEQISARERFYIEEARAKGICVNKLTPLGVHKTKEEKQAYHRESKRKHDEKHKGKKVKCFYCNKEFCAGQLGFHILNKHDV